MATNRRARPELLAYRLNEAARLLSVSRWTISRLIEAGELDSIKMPGARNAPVLIPASSLAAFLDRHTERASAG